MESPNRTGLAGEDEANAVQSSSPARLPRMPDAESVRGFEGLADESTDGARRLDTDWLYQRQGQVFGPVKPRALLEMLYVGELDADSPIATTDGEFQPLRHFGVFRAHLPKVERHRAELEAARASEALAARARLRRHLAWALLAALVFILGSAGLYSFVQSSRERAAFAEKTEKEARLRRELEALLASVSIEPPLMPLVDDELPAEKTRRREGRAVARFFGGGGSGGGTGELTRKEIMQGVGAAFGGFKRCIMEQLRRDSESVPEQLVLTFAIANDGSARDVNLTDRHLRRSPLNECMAAQVAALRWRRFSGEVQNVEYPITIARPQ